MTYLCILPDLFTSGRYLLLDPDDIPRGRTASTLTLSPPKIMLIQTIDN